MRSFQIFPFVFQFKKPSGTSRGIMTQKKSWFIQLIEHDVSGWGECSIIENLSPDYQDVRSYESNLIRYLKKWESGFFDPEELDAFPSILFGIETAQRDLFMGGRQRLFETNFTSGRESIQINGLIWMGTTQEMTQQIEEKLNAGFRCIKMKIGAISLKDELKILRDIRASFSPKEIEIRVDANGAYTADQAREILEHLAALDIHSIEQPIRAGQWDDMAKLCENTPCPIALDEELIGVPKKERKRLLEHIRPQYIVLKPSLHGGLSGTQDWISLAEQKRIAWWMTSALESNLGLNAIAQLASCNKLNLPQGLGTGSLYKRNIPSPLKLKGDRLSFDPNENFDLSILQ
jgi:o-succinylbenzoate synthase